MTERMEMLGAEGVSRGLINMLRTRLPRHLQRQRTQRGLTVEQLPDFEHTSLFTTPQPFASVEKFPALMVVMESTDGRATNRQEAPTGSYDELVMHYRVQLHVWTIGETYSMTELMVQRYVLAARAAVISGRVIGDQNSGNWGEVMLDRLREGYTDPLQEQSGNGWLGGGWVEFHVQAHELLWTDRGWDASEPVVETPVTDVRAVHDVAVHPALLDEPQ